MLNTLNLLDYTEKNLIEIKKILRSNLKDTNHDVTKLMKKLPAEEGKLIRAILVLLGGSFGNIDKQRLMEISAAIELLHSATLVHDDIVDETDIRRGHETLHKKYNLKSGLFAGDYLFSQSYVLFSKNCSPKSIYDVSETIKFICKSEISQYFSINNFDCNTRDYLRRINGKCASLFSLSLSIGANEGNADSKVVKKLKNIGYYAGMAFQLIDDLLDISSSSEVLGKPAGNDILQGIYNLPIIYELKKENIELLNFLKNKQVAEAVSLLRCSEGYKKSKELAAKYTNKALTLVDELPDISERYFLKQLLEKLFNRNY
jgi:heptaprenyl diphosphate synthase